MNRMLVPVLVALLYVFTVAVVAADGGDQVSRAYHLPEVPYALIYPATGFICFGVYRLLSAVRDRRS